ncbi:esterase/lipase family protein [Pseudomonas sp.]|uniref:esterase/lipase family protein n=1 Tax=Pseudomonas sp. TaxID=306 RepID=UPI003C747409
MTGIRISLAILLLASSGCSLLKLDKEMQQARQELLLIAGQLQASDSGRSALVTLLDAQGKLVNYRIAAPGEIFYFTEAPASYQLLAFDDRNGNFILDHDEPRHWLPKAQGAPISVQPEPEERARLGRLNPLRLATTDLQPAPALDLSLALLYREQPRLQRNYLQPVNFDDPRFNEANVRLGAWQPLTFMRELGYGLYLLAPWDKDKEPIFLVHGINSSPRVWQELAANLDLQRFQLVLFHYPSGLPLNNSAYMLSVGMRDLQLRHAPRRMHVFAHSMGGLVARRAVQLLSADDGQKLCLFITLSTPWDGHPSAASGADVPLDIPVWRDMAPGSSYLQSLFATPLPTHMRQWLLVSYGGNTRMLAEPNDGVVPLASELRAAAQDEAERLYLLDETHTSILNNARSTALLERALDSLPTEGCKAAAE